MKHYPVYLDLDGKKVVVVGGGRVALRKVQRLVEAGAKCLVVSPDLHHELDKMVQRGIIQHIRACFSEKYLENAWLVVAATDAPDVQEAVYAAANKRRIFCNVVDVPKRCSFIVPALVQRGALGIAVATGGRCPGLSKSIRRYLETLFPEQFTLYIEVVGKLRRHIIKNVKNDHEKERLMNKLFDLSASKYFIEDNMDAIETWAFEIGGEDALKIIRGAYG